MRRPTFRHVAAAAGALALVLAAAGCDSGANLRGPGLGAATNSPSESASPSESESESEPSPDASSPEQTSEETENEGGSGSGGSESGGSGVDACYDGTCEITAVEGTEIPLDPGLGLGLDAIYIADVGGDLVTVAQDFGYVQTGPGGTGTLNGLSFEVLDIAGNEVTLRLYP